jgi:hypothetical protein
VKVHTDFQQGTPEWFALRAGKATASEFASILAKGQGKMRASYLRRIVAERLPGKPVETYRNAHMDRGQEQEPLARMSYERLSDNLVQQVSFIEHDGIAAGCSPDGLIIGMKRGAEIKCVIPTVQVETILAGGYPSEHKAQIQGSLWITGYEAWDFCSYSPDMPEKLRTYIFTVERDDPYIAMIENEVRGFLADVDKAIERLGFAGVALEELLRRSLKEAA